MRCWQFGRVSSSSTKEARILTMDEVVSEEDGVEYIESGQVEENSPQPRRNDDVRFAWDDNDSDLTEPLRWLDHPRITSPGIPDEELTVHGEVHGSPPLLHSFKPLFDDLKLLPDSAGSQLTRQPIKSPHEKNDDLQVDIRGILRGSCSLCKKCTNFKRSSDDSKLQCVICGHPPAKHQNLGTRNSPTRLPDLSVTPDPLPSLNVNKSSPSLFVPYDYDVMSSLFDTTDEKCVANFAEDAAFKSMCAFNGCNNVTTFDENSGYSSQFCDKHQSKWLLLKVLYILLYVGQKEANQLSEHISGIKNSYYLLSKL